MAAVIGAVAYLGPGASEVSAAELKDTALGSMENVDTFKMDVTVKTSIGTRENSLEITTYMEGTVDRNDRKVRATMRVPGGDENLEYTMYIVENTAYLNMNAVIPENAPRPENFSGWIKEEAQSWKSQSRFGMQKELLERAKVERLEDEEVNGVKCQVLRMEPTRAYWNYIIRKHDKTGDLSKNGVVERRNHRDPTRSGGEHINGWVVL